MFNSPPWLQSQFALLLPGAKTLLACARGGWATSGFENRKCFSMLNLIIYVVKKSTSSPSWAAFHKAVVNIVSEEAKIGPGGQIRGPAKVVSGFQVTERHLRTVMLSIASGYMNESPISYPICCCRCRAVSETPSAGLPLSGPGPQASANQVLII
jgi:hypothetical protein